MRHVLSALLLLLLLSVQQASGRAVLQPENGTGESYATHYWSECASVQDDTGENWPLGYDLVSDVCDGPNLYAYVRQNPWTAFDPVGLWLTEMFPTWAQPYVAPLSPGTAVIDHVIASCDTAGAGYNTSVKQGRGKLNGCGTAFGIFLAKLTGVSDGVDALSGSQFQHQKDGTLKVVPCEGVERGIKGVLGALALAGPLAAEALPVRGALTASSKAAAKEIEYLYHGTTESFAKNMVTKGLDAEAAAAYTMDGAKRGMFWTPYKEAAEGYAAGKAANASRLFGSTALKLQRWCVCRATSLSRI